MKNGIIISVILLIAVMTLAIVNIVNNYSTGNELTESLLRETVESAMLDAVDISYYRATGGIIRMDKEKFAENFTRRFAENVSSNKDYNIKIYDIKEIPPKVSVQVGSGTTATFQGENFDIVNRVSAIIESKFTNEEIDLDGDN